MKKDAKKNRLSVKLVMVLVLLALCAVLSACATTQVRGQYDVVIGTARY